MADKTIPELEEIVVADGSSSFLVIDDGTQTYKIKPVNIPGLPRSVIVDLEVTSAITGFSLIDARGYAYADKTGQWKLNFNLAFTKATAVEGGILAFAGLEFRAGATQSLYISTLDGVPASAYTAPGSNEIEFVIDSTTLVGIQISGDVEIDGEPEWYEGSGSGGDGFDPEPGAVNSVNGQIGDVVLTTSEIAEGARLYFTESRARGAVVDGNITSGVTTKATSQDALFTALAAKQSTSQKNVAGGYAGLDGSGKLFVSQLPSAILGSLIYRGALNASLGSYPSSPAAGDYWVISVAGTISGVSYAVKDWAVYNGTTWDKVSGASVSVTSVNGQDGEVILTTDEIAEGATNQYFTTARARGAAVEDAIVDAVTTIAPSQNAVFDALAAKESLANKGQPNGYPPLDSGSLIPEEFLPDVAGGLAAVPVTATGNSTNNTIEEVVLPGATITRTMPDLPGPSDDPLAILIVDKAGTASETLLITLAPFSGKKFERAAAINDTISIDYAGGWILVTAAPGATSYTIQTQANTTYVPGMVPGYTGATAIPAGMVGHIQKATGSAVSLTTTQFSDGGLTALTLTPGVYLLQSTAQFFPQNTTVVTGYQIAIGTVTGNSATGIVAAENLTAVDFTGQTTVGSRSLNDTYSSPVWYVLVTATTTYYAKIYSIFSTSTMTGTGSLTAVRIA